MGLAFLLRAADADFFQHGLGGVEGEFFVDVHPPGPVSFANIFGEGFVAGFGGGVEVEFRGDAPPVVLLDVSSVL